MYVSDTPLEKEERKTKAANVYRGEPRRFIGVAIPISSGLIWTLTNARECACWNGEIAELFLLLVLIDWWKEENVDL